MFILGEHEHWDYLTMNVHMRLCAPKGKKVHSPLAGGSISDKLPFSMATNLSGAGPPHPPPSHLPFLPVKDPYRPSAAPEAAGRAARIGSPGSSPRAHALQRAPLWQLSCHWDTYTRLRVSSGHAHNVLFMGAREVARRVAWSGRAFVQHCGLLCSSKGALYFASERIVYSYQMSCRWYLPGWNACILHCFRSLELFFASSQNSKLLYGEPPTSPRASRKFSSPPPLAIAKNSSPNRRRKLSLNIPIITGGKALDLAALSCSSNGYASMYSSMSPFSKTTLDINKLYVSSPIASKIPDEGEDRKDKMEDAPVSKQGKSAEAIYFDS